MLSESEVVAVVKHIIKFLSDGRKSLFLIVGMFLAVRLYLLLYLELFKVEVVVVPLR